MPAWINSECLGIDARDGKRNNAMLSESDDATKSDLGKQLKKDRKVRNRNLSKESKRAFIKMGCYRLQ